MNLTQKMGVNLSYHKMQAVPVPYDTRHVTHVINLCWTPLCVEIVEEITTRYSEHNDI